MRFGLRALGGNSVTDQERPHTTIRTSRACRAPPDRAAGVVVVVVELL